MGLDQYAFAIDNNGEKEEIAYWRKHPNLQGWMENLYISKGGQEEFNCVPVELEHEDLDNLEQAVTNNELPDTQGFFFGGDSDEHYKEQDLKFIKNARDALDSGLHVEYSSWW
jgi:hypothetical protein